MFCKKCGNKIEPGKDFCEKCGEPQHIYDRQEYFGREKRNKKNITYLIVITILFILFFIICGIYYMYVTYEPDESLKVTPTDAEASASDASSEDNSGYSLLMQETLELNTGEVTSGDALSEEIIIAKSSDIAGAEAIKTAVENILYFSTAEKMNYLTSQTNKIIIFNNDLLNADTQGVYADIINVLGGSIPEIKYTENGASGYAFMITEQKEVYVWISSADNITAWQMCPVVDDDYVID